METIIAGLISAASAIAVCIISHNRTVAILEVKIEQLTDQVKKHNNLIDRMYQVEKKIAVLEEKMQEE